jgi:sodium/proline symporter
MTMYGTVSGMISGGAMVFIWEYVIAKFGGAFAIYELFPAFVTSCLVIVAVSLLTKKPDAEVIKVYDEVTAEISK